MRSLSLGALLACLIPWISWAQERPTQADLERQLGRAALAEALEGNPLAAADGYAAVVWRASGRWPALADRARAVLRRIRRERALAHADDRLAQAELELATVDDPQPDKWLAELPAGGTDSLWTRLLRAADPVRRGLLYRALAGSRRQLVLAHWREDRSPTARSVGARALLPRPSGRASQAEVGQVERELGGHAEGWAWLVRHAPDAVGRVAGDGRPKGDLAQALAHWCRDADSLPADERARVERSLLALSPFQGSLLTTPITDSVDLAELGQLELLAVVDEVGDAATRRAYLLAPAPLPSKARLRRTFQRLSDPAEALELYRLAGAHAEDAGFLRGLEALLSWGRAGEPDPAELGSWRRTLSPRRQLLFVEALRAVGADRAGDPLGGRDVWPRPAELPPQARQSRWLYSKLVALLTSSERLDELALVLPGDLAALPGELAEAPIPVRSWLYDLAWKKDAGTGAMLETALSQPGSLRRLVGVLALQRGRPAPAGEPAAPQLQLASQRWAGLDDTTRQALAEGLLGPRGEPARSGVQFLARHYPELPTAAVRRRFWQTVLELRLDDQPQIRPLLSAASADEDGEVRSLAQRVRRNRERLAELRARLEAGAPLGTTPRFLLDRLDPRAAAERLVPLLALLEERGTLDALPPLLRLFDHPDPAVRQRSARAYRAVLERAR